MGTWGFVYPILGFEEMVETQSDNYSSKSVGNQHTGKWFHQSVCHEKVQKKHFFLWKKKEEKFLGGNWSSKKFEI